MRIAYLVGHYPAITHTFILREIQQLRRRGMQIDTFSVWRAGEQDLLAKIDRAEHENTYAFLPPAASDYIGAHVKAAVRTPRDYVGTFVRAMRLSFHGQRGRLLGLSWFLEAVVLKRECERRGIRHVHVHLDGTAIAMGLLAAYMGNGRRATGPWSFSMTVHGSKEFFDVARQRLARKVRAALFVVCVSDFTRSQLMALVDEEQWPKLHVVHCGVDTDEFLPPCDGRANGGSVQILTVGRLDNMKGVAVLVEALAELRRRRIDVALTVVGDGPKRDSLQSLARRLSVADHITWVGAIAQDEIRAHYQAADIFCLPSFAEGVPVVLMEAMSTGLPVVANGITGIPELVEQGVSGVLVRPARSDLLADALARLASDAGLRAQMGRAGRQKVRREFDSRGVGIALGELFVRELAAGRRMDSTLSAARR
jgi:glycosyltransferase involved in cell wall biosynthesis